MLDDFLTCQNRAYRIAAAIALFWFSSLAWGCGGRSHAESPDGGQAGAAGTDAGQGGAQDGNAPAGASGAMAAPDGPLGGPGALDASPADTTTDVDVDGGRACDSGNDLCGGDCPMDMTSCHGACIPVGACCEESDCTTSCQTCSSAHSCVPVKNADDDSCQGDHICDATGACIGRFTVFPRPVGQYAASITSGPDGNLWFASGPFSATAVIGRTAIDGTTTVFPVPTQSSTPEHVIAGADGNVWFSEYDKSQIGSVTPSGKITEYPLDPAFVFVNPIVQAPSSQGPTSIWFAASSDVSLGVQSLASGSIMLSGRETPVSMVFGPDSKLWYVSDLTGTVGKIDVMNRDVSIFTIPTPPNRTAPLPPPGSPRPMDIAIGADGALWFTEMDDNQIGRIDQSGAITEFDLPTPASQPGAICLGSDGNVWFIEQVGHGMIPVPGGEELIGALGRITPRGEISEYALPNASGIDLATGPDGNLWIADGPQIIRFRVK